MRKPISLPALAAGLAAAYVCSGASAQAVTVYGVADVFIESGKANSKMWRVQSGGLNGSRLGFRGTEDIGNDLKAEFTFEHGLLLDKGTPASGSAFWNRQSFVGLNGAFGSLRLGRQYSPTVETQDRNDPALCTTGYGSPFNSGVMRTFSRLNNALRYQTPSFGGASATLMVSLGENASGGGNHVYNGNLRYSGGPVNVELAHGEQKPGSAAQETKTITTLAGTYSFTDLKLMGALQSTRNDSRAVNVQDDRSELMFGGTLQLGAGRVYAVYGQGKVKGVDDSTARHYSLGYSHELSKRTALYAAWQEVKNPANLAYRTAGFTFDAIEEGLPASAGVKASAMAVGIRHRF